MKKAAILLFLFTVNLFAQAEDYRAPDYNAIEKASKDKKSAFHYDRLIARYHSADTTMTLDEKRHLYYGYSFTDAYAPYGRSESETALRELLTKESVDSEDLKKILELTDDILRQFPFSLRTKQYRIYTYRELGMTAEAERENIQAEMIIDAILSTGDGTSKEKAFYVINTSNEYEILGVLGFEFGGSQSLVDHRYDYLTLSENPYRLKGFYFDVSRPLASFKM